MIEKDMIFYLIAFDYGWIGCDDEILSDWKEDNAVGVSAIDEVNEKFIMYVRGKGGSSDV